MIKLAFTALFSVAITTTLFAATPLAPNPEDGVAIEDTGDTGSGLLPFSAVITGGGGYGFAAVTENIDDNNYFNWFADGAVGVPLGEKLWVQADLGGFTNKVNVSRGTEVPKSFSYAGLHIAFRNPDVGTIGFIGQLGESHGGQLNTADTHLVGIEGQRYFGNLTLGGQFGFVGGNDGFGNGGADVIDSGIFWRGEGRYYFNDNLRLAMDFSWVEGEEHEGAGDEIDAYSWDVRLEKMCSRRPVSTFIGYRGMDMWGEDNGIAFRDEATEHTIYVGASIHLGGKGSHLSLFDVDHRGVGAFSQPDSGRWAAFSGSIVDP